MNPLLYQINTRCWLRELSDQKGQKVTLSTVPEAEFARWQKLGFTHVWLMGVWTTGAKALQQAVHEPNLRKAYDHLIPGWTKEDVGGSPYSIADYKVIPSLGGEEGLKEFRARLHQFGMKLILDFVPNHVGFDHPWVAQRPELFIQSPREVEGTFAQKTTGGTKWIAYAKDPYFPYWSDVAQLDYRNPITRAAMQELLLSLAERCDGVRCDMAMLLLNDVIARTWAHLPFKGKAPTTEFWSDAIPAAKKVNPDFIFMAEVYWGLEGHLQWLGFDYTYDKQMYDDFIFKHPWDVPRRVLESPAEYVEKSIHFLENHDEPRVAANLSLEEHQVAAMTILGLPGMRLLHEGQLTGAKLKIPVQLARRPVEPVQPDILAMYEKMLAALRHSSVGRGEGRILVPRAAWEENPTGQNFVLVLWQSQPREFDLVAVNVAPHDSQCYVPLSVVDIEVHDWFVRDLLGGEIYQRDGKDLAEDGLYLDMPGQTAQLFHFTLAETGAHLKLPDVLSGQTTSR